MPQSTIKGRGKASSIKTNTIPNKSATQAILRKQDEIIEKLNLILAAIEASTDGDTLQAALDTAEIKAALEKVKLI
jgi:hypothetical protein